MSGRRAPGHLPALVAFAVAMGWLEAVVVVYIRELLGFTGAQPMPPPDQVAASLRSIPWLVPTEQGREAATLVMLAAVGWLGGTTVRARIGTFLLAFGVWDLTYYGALYSMLRWPQSLGTMDLLFLIPPSPWWYQPVWVPVTISVGLVAAGLSLRAKGR